MTPLHTQTKRISTFPLSFFLGGGARARDTEDTLEVSAIPVRGEEGRKHAGRPPATPATPRGGKGQRAREQAEAWRAAEAAERAHLH